MWKKSISLSRLLLQFFSFVAGAVLILLVCMDWYLIKTYQIAQRDRKAAILDASVQGIGTDMERLSDIIYDFYENNRNFAALEHINSELEEFNYIYELDTALRERMLLEECVDGYFIFYGAEQSARYYVDSARVGLYDIDAIKAHVKARAGNEAANWKWSFACIREKKYAFLVVCKKNVSLCLMYSLSRWEDPHQVGLEEGVLLSFAETGGAFAENQTDWQFLSTLQSAGESYNARQGSYSVSARRIGGTGLWLCMQVPITFSYYMNLPQVLLLIITACTVFCTWFLYGQIRAKLVTPLEKLVEAMNRIRDGEWDTKIEAGARFEEIQKVDQALEAMMVEIKKQKMLVYERTIEKQQIQLRFLQLQLKPHFYLNGLKTLNALALDGDRQKMQDLIINLSEHVRYLLQAEREIVPLCQEVAFVRNYAELQKNTTGRPSSVVWDLAVDTESWQVPVLCIQTFVENSFKYAKLGNAQKALILRISAMELETEDGRFLDICVRDNGAGYSEALLQQINDRPQAENGSTDNIGVGIRNLQRRCELHFGGRAEYNFYNEGGAVSELILPWSEEDNDADPDRG